MASRFLDYPPEIREQIYSDLLSTTSSRVESDKPDEPAHYKYQLAILSTCHQIYREAKKVFQDNVFVKITTPWPEAIEHIRSEGKVPSVVIGQKAEAFRDFHLWVSIDTPGGTHPRDHERFSMLICLEDLEAFNRFWHFSNLNFYGLNRHLRLKLTIQDPHVPDRKIPKALQTRLLMPFGMIKELDTFTVHGSKLLPSVDEALQKERAIPDPTPEQCLEKAFCLKDAGKSLLKLANTVKLSRNMSIRSAQSTFMSRAAFAPCIATASTSVSSPLAHIRANAATTRAVSYAYNWLPTLSLPSSSSKNTPRRISGASGASSSSAIP